MPALPDGTGSFAAAASGGKSYIAQRLVELGDRAWENRQLPDSKDRTHPIDVFFSFCILLALASPFFAE